MTEIILLGDDKPGLDYRGQCILVLQEKNR